MKGSSKKLTPPDGGWGWMVVLGCSIMNLSTRSIEPSFGLLFGDLLKEMNVATTGAAIIMSTLDAMINFSGLFVGPLIKKWSFRKVGIAGGIIGAIALMSTSPASSMLHILVTYSILAGFGFGLETASTFVALNSYFEKKRGQAVGLAMTGTAIGFMAMPQVVSFLLTHFDFRGTCIILGAICLNSVVGASLLHPVKWHSKPTPPEEPTQHEMQKIPENEATEPSDSLLRPPRPSILRKISTVSDSYWHSTGAVPSKPSCHGRSSFVGFVHHSSSNFGRKFPHVNSGGSLAKRKTSVISNVSYLDFMGSTMHFDEESENEDEGIQIDFKPKQERDENMSKGKALVKKSMSWWSRVSRVMDFDLLGDKVYLNILFGLSITYVAELNFKMVVPFFMANLNYSKQETASALSLMAIADIIARVTVPPILDRLAYSRRVTLLFGCVGVAFFRSLLAEQTEWVPLIIALMCHGFFRGFTLINFPLVISEYASQEKFPAALGLSMVSKGCFIVVLGPLVGFIRDVTESYPICIHAQSIMILSCVVAWGLELIFTRAKKSGEPVITIEEPPV